MPNYYPAESQKSKTIQTADVIGLLNKQMSASALTHTHKLTGICSKIEKILFSGGSRIMKSQQNVKASNKKTQTFRVRSIS